MEKEPIHADNAKGTITSKKTGESRFTRRTIAIIAIIVLMLLVFRAGMLVGYMKAGFSSRLGDNYYRTFGGEHDDIPGGHGVTGKVLKISSSSIIVEGTDNIERLVTIGSDTLVRQLRETASTTDIRVNDNIVVIGSPGQNGEIAAKLIRIIP